VVAIASIALDRAVRRELADLVVETDEGGLVITDDVFVERTALLIVEPLPALCAAALQRVAADPLVVGAVTSDRLSDLRSALLAVDEGLVIAGPDLKAAAASAPSLSARQIQVLRELLQWRGNREIARRTNVSEATVKRELADIGRVLGAAGRGAIASRAQQLGFRAPSVGS
jgi:DNA-binding NarL/FixJ family response regulator